MRCKIPEDVQDAHLTRLFHAQGINSWKYLALRFARVDEIGTVAIGQNE
jgi:hypothetical protein